MIEQPASTMDIATVLERIKEEVARRKLRAGDGLDDSHATQHFESEGTLGGQGEPAAVALRRLHESAGAMDHKDVYALADFFRFQDEDFVRNAYRAILRREPDPSGASAFLKQLRTASLSKTDILGRLRFSREGRATAVPVQGLAVRYAWRIARRIPIVGRVLGIAQYIVSLPKVVQAHERLEAAVFEQQLDARRGINGVITQIEDLLQRLQRRLASDAERSQAGFDLVNRQAAQLSTSLRDEVAALNTSLRDEIAQLHATLAPRAEVAALAERVGGLERSGHGHLEELRRHARTLLDQERRLRLLLDSTQDPAADPGRGAGSATMAAEREHLLDAFYVSFEDQFRGAPDDIKQRAEVYLSVAQRAAAATAGAPILDLGCGRGEWLALLKCHGVSARGVDQNRVMVQVCNELDLDAVEGDAVRFLRSLPAETLGGVTGFHVIEHLPFASLIELLDEVLRVLKPGGLVAFETPNPENLVVGACTFWSDPTHQRPLPPFVTKFLVENRGFADVEIWRLHPCPPEMWLQSGDQELRRRVNEALYGAQDYAVIGWKGATVTDLPSRA